MPRFFFVAVLLLMFMTACGSDDSSTDSGQAPAGDDDSVAADDTAADDAADDSADDVTDDAADDTATDDSADDDTGECPDADGDGYTAAGCGGTDCNDTDPDIHPGAADVCGDEIDNDCDGTTDNPDDPPVALPGFIFGHSQGGSYATQYLPDLGMHWFRWGITLRTLKPTVTDPELTMADIEADPTLIDQFMDEAAWTGTDNWMSQFIAAGIQPLPSLGLGWINTLPDIDGETATPDKLGREHYLAQQYRYVRAVVERYDGDGYKDADGIVVKIWQIENELNQAGITTLYGWREPAGIDGLFSAWMDWDFLTDLLDTINRAVHDADEDAITIQNIHTDIPPDFSHTLLQPSWIDAARLWRDKMDVIGFDAYPNYYESEPVRGEVIGERVTTLIEASCGKPVVALEIGYPSGPAERGYSEENQAQFIEEAFQSAYDAGISGYLQFGLRTNDTHTVTITPADLQAIAELGPLLTGGDVLGTLLWGILNYDYAFDPHFIEFLQSVEGYWGVVRPDGSQKPGYAVLQDIAAGLESR